MNQNKEFGEFKQSFYLLVFSLAKLLRITPKRLAKTVDLTKARDYALEFSKEMDKKIAEEGNKIKKALKVKE